MVSLYNQFNCGFNKSNSLSYSDYKIRSASRLINVNNVVTAEVI
jgi:hypothetical protein